MQIVKSITAREFSRNILKVKKQLWGGEFWSDGGYVERLVMALWLTQYEIMLKCEGIPEEKDAYKQMNLFDFK